MFAEDGEGQLRDESMRKSLEALFPGEEAGVEFLTGKLDSDSSYANEGAAMIVFDKLRELHGSGLRKAIDDLVLRKWPHDTPADRLQAIADGNDLDSAKDLANLNFIIDPMNPYTTDYNIDPGLRPEFFRRFARGSLKRALDGKAAFCPDSDMALAYVQQVATAPNIRFSQGGEVLGSLEEVREFYMQKLMSSYDDNASGNVNKRGLGGRKWFAAESVLHDLLNVAAIDRLIAEGRTLDVSSPDEQDMDQ